MSVFTPEVLKELEALAPLDFAKATAFAEAKGLKPKSVVAAVVRAGIPYKRKERVSKTGGPVVTKEDLVACVAEKLGLATEELAGLDKAPKLVLQKLVDNFPEAE
jgi:hypothetical protein